MPLSERRRNVNGPLPKSLEARCREWIDTPPQYRMSCPACAKPQPYGKPNAGYVHGRGCFLVTNAYGFVFGDLGR